jgi:4-alpha-glucanotransferase
MSADRPDRASDLEDGYHDGLGAWHPLSPATREAIVEALGEEPAGDAGPRVWVLRAGETRAIASAEIVLEDGSCVPAKDRLPADLPDGYHELRLGRGRQPIRLIVAPLRCPAPPSPVWGWAVQLYALRSAESWGFGDLADLGRLGRWAAALGARFLLLNPLHAPLPTVPQQSSPYYPSSRIYRNPLYIRVEDVPGAREAALELEPQSGPAHALNRDRVIDRNAVFRLKLEALELLWRRFPGSPAFGRYRAREGRLLEQYAAFCVLAEQFGGDWRAWESAYREPDTPAVHRFAAAHADRIDFHAWLQWLLDEQLGHAAAALPLVQDLPIGFDPAGADAWIWQGALAPGMSVGAPPDQFNPRGQDWGVPPFSPVKLRAAGYEPFIQTIRATLRHASGIRIDHVLGLFRLFWIPQGGAPADGAYVRYPTDELLAIVALESQRAGAFAIGEDLGTVGEGVRERLADYGLLSSRLLWFEDGAPASYPELAAAAVSTHDLPTIAGVWTRRDYELQRSFGLEPDRESHEALRTRLRATTHVPNDASAAVVIERTYQVLSSAPSALLIATLEDALAVGERPNAPGANGYPSWSLALPALLEDLEAAPLATAIARALAR